MYNKEECFCDKCNKQRNNDNFIDDLSLLFYGIIIITMAVIAIII